MQPSLLTSKSILGVSTRFGAQTKFLTCDSEPAHTKARKEMKLKHPDKIFLPCIAHQVNLVVKDILKKIPELSSVASSTASLVGTIQRSTQLTAALAEQRIAMKRRQHTLTSPGETRWCSISTMFDSVLENQLPLQVSLIA